MVIDKVVRLGTRQTYGGRFYSIYCQVRFKDGRLSISGVEGPTSGGNCLGSCGQIDMHLRAEQTSIKLAPGWTRGKLAEFFEVWKDWHLNDMQSGCEHQRALGWTYEKHHDPKTFKGELCPTCGYSIGSAWFTKDVPKEVINFLTNLPVTDKTPAWI